MCHALSGGDPFTVNLIEHEIRFTRQLRTEPEGPGIVRVEIEVEVRLLVRPRDAKHAVEIATDFRGHAAAQKAV